MATSRGRRPANRPSRKHEIVQAALELIALQGHDAISVADIAAHAGMTSAAFYYHFSSKDEPLEAFAEEFAQTWVSVVSERLAAVRTVADLGELVDRIVGWLDDHEQQASVFFVGSVEATPVVEAIRARARNTLYAEAGKAIRRARPDVGTAEATVAGISFVALLEIAARSRLEQDDAYRSLGPSRFRVEASMIAELIPG